MPFSVSPSTVAPLGPLAASGTGPRKVLHRIIVQENDPETPGHVLTTFTMPANQRFSNRMMVAPSGSSRTVTLELQKFRPDRVWAQTASADVKLLLLAGGSGGGTTPIPNDPPPPPPPDITPPVLQSVTIDQITTTSCRVSGIANEPVTWKVRFWVDPANVSETALVASLTTTPSVVVTGLASGVRYNLQAVAHDAADNPAVSSVRFVNTLPTSIPPGPEPPGSVVDVDNTAELETQIVNLNVSEIVLNPGTYQPDSAVAADYFMPPWRPADNPLLIRALNVPAVATDPFDVIFRSRMYLRNRLGSRSEWRGISFENINVGTTGAVTFGAYAPEPGPDHVTFKTVRHVNNVPLNASNSHHWYLSSGSSSYITIDDFFVQGVNRSGFTGFHAYHLDLGHHITLKNGVIRKVYAGLLMYGTSGAVPPTLTDFLAEDMDIQDAGTGVDIRYVQGVLRRVAQSNVGPGTSYIKGPITLDDCPTLPSPVP